MEQPPPRMKGKKLKDKTGDNSLPAILSSCLSSSIASASPNATSITIGNEKEEEKTQVPKIGIFIPQLPQEESPPISPVRISRSKIWLDANVNVLDSSLYFTNLSNNLYRILGSITCTKPSLEKEKEMRIYFETNLGKQIREINGDNKVQLTVSTAFSSVGLLVGAVFFDVNYYFSPLKININGGNIRAMTLNEFEDFISSVDRSLTTTSWCIRVNGLVTMT